MSLVIGQTILDQLGGNDFRMMTDARRFCALTNPPGLSFELKRNFAKDGINRVLIELTPGDDYTVTFSRYNFNTRKVRLISKHEGIYCDQLRPLFSRVTALVLEVPQIFCAKTNKRLF